MVDHETKLTRWYNEHARALAAHKLLTENLERCDMTEEDSMIFFDRWSILPSTVFSAFMDSLNF